MKTPIALAAMLLLATAAQAQNQSFASALAPEASGATGSGTVLLDYDPVARTLSIQSLWFGLSGTTTVAHIHCCTATSFAGTAGVAVTPGTLPSFPVGVTFGAYSTLLDLTLDSTYTGAFRTANGGTSVSAETALIASLYSGKAYFNVHSSTFTGGEIRGFPTAVPEPSTWAIMGLGLAGIASITRRRNAA
jgi:hypothetical protein